MESRRLARGLHCPTSMQKLLGRLGYVKLDRYGLVKTAEDRILSMRPATLDDGMGGRIVGWRDDDITAVDLPRWEPAKPLATTVASIPSLSRPPVPMTARPVAPPIPVAPAAEEPEDDWEWTIAIARARAAAEETPRVAKASIPALPARLPQAPVRSVSVTAIEVPSLVAKPAKPVHVPPPLPPAQPPRLPIQARRTRQETVPPVPQGAKTEPMLAVVPQPMPVTRTQPVAVVAQPTPRPQPKPVMTPAAKPVAAQPQPQPVMTPAARVRPPTSPMIPSVLANRVRPPTQPMGLAPIVPIQSVRAKSPSTIIPVPKLPTMASLPRGSAVHAIPEVPRRMAKGTGPQVPRSAAPTQDVGDTTRVDLIGEQTRTDLPRVAR